MIFRVKILLVLIFSCFCSLNAQEIDNSSNDEQEPDSVRQINMSDESFETPEQIAIRTLQKEKKLLKDTILLLKQDTLEYSQKLTNKEGEISTLTRDKQSLEKDRDSYKQKFDNLTRELEKLDGVIYKQCLLYPLEAKFNAKSVDEAIRSVDAISSLLKNPSKDFLDTKNIYYPLLKSYYKYNQELLHFVENEIQYVEMTDWVIGNSHKQKFSEEIKQLSYYKDCYIKRNIPPYKSIVYLDDIIDSFLSILKKKGNVEIDLKNLLQKLQPNQ